jgi:ABC-2 type transport system permease protein
MKSKQKKNKNRKILSREIQMYFKKEFQYKGQMIAWIIADIIKIIGLCFIWLMSAKVNGNVEQGYVVTYYILIMLVSKFTSDYTIEHGVRNILSGKFSNFLLKPFNYLLEYLGINIGSNALRVGLFLPAFILGIIIASKNNLWIMNLNILSISLGFIAILIGFLISFFVGNIISLIAIRIKEMDSIRIFFYNIASLLSGEFIPLVFLSGFIARTFKLLPFRYTLSFPVELFIGEIEKKEILLGFLIAIIWLFVLFITYKIIYKKAVEKYEAEGI